MTLFRRTFTKRGAPPGTIVPPAVFVEPELHVISFTADVHEEHGVEKPSELRPLLDSDRVVWIDVHGLGDGTIVRELGELLGLHPLAVSDVIHVGQRPKVDAYDGVLFVVVQMATLIGEEEVRWEQVSMFLGPNYVLTFQETPGDCLDPLRERLRQPSRQIRNAGADYLACMVVDAIVDGYFPIIEFEGERIEVCEDEILDRPTPSTLAKLYEIKRNLTTFRRAVWPLRDALTRLMRNDELALSDSARLFLRDTTDHTMQVADVTESYRELATSLVDVYLSMVGQRTNEIMRVLTVMATIFIPLTFVAGVYGMNFDTRKPMNMPELGWSLGYPFFWVVCLVIVGMLLVLFRHFGWLRSSDR